VTARFGRRAALAALLAIATRSAAAEPATPEAFLSSIYKPYLDKNFMGSDFIEQANSLFVPDLAKALKDESARNAGSVGKLDFDPFILGQAWEISDLSISAKADGDTATGVVVFRNFNKPNRISYRLTRLKDGWRIADLEWPEPINGVKSLRALYGLK
jgi:hypothetical protein